MQVGDQSSCSSSNKHINQAHRGADTDQWRTRHHCQWCRAGRYMRWKSSQRPKQAYAGAGLRKKKVRHAACLVGSECLSTSLRFCLRMNMAKIFCFPPRFFTTSSQHKHTKSVHKVQRTSALFAGGLAGGHAAEQLAWRRAADLSQICQAAPGRPTLHMPVHMGSIFSECTWGRLSVNAQQLHLKHQHI